MANNENKTTISAATQEQFNVVLEKIMKLPNGIKEQISRAEYSPNWGVMAFIDSPHPTVYLPNSCTSIKDFNDYIGVYSPHFFFKINPSIKSNGINFVFIETPDLISKS